MIYQPLQGSYTTFQGDQLVNILARSALPTVKGWNRLEGRPRTKEFDKTLRVEVRDPLWMLTRQWQIGEFSGQDTGSPAFAKVKMATTHINRYQIRNNASQPYDEAIPLEARVERERLPIDEIQIGEAHIPQNLSLSLQISRYWFRLLNKGYAEGHLTRDYKQDFKKAYPILLPPHNELSSQDEQSSGNPVGQEVWQSIHAHQEVWQMFAAAAGRSMDGCALYRKILEGGNILEGMTIVPKDEPVIRELELSLIRWVGRLYSQPGSIEDSAWAPSYLEYQFACSAPDYDGQGQIVLTAEEYHQGHLDWYAFDVHPDIREIEPPNTSLYPAFESRKEDTFDFIPTVIEFGGMPNMRWWEFEDRKTNFGDINVHTTDLAKLLLIEFGLIYSNDWFLCPFELPVGSLARVEGLAVTNVFGERIWIENAGSQQQDNWQRWAMYNLNVRGANHPADHSIFIPPAVDRLQESKPLEEVHLIRDEMANMVWAIESQVSLASGEAKDGYETAIELVNYLKSFLPSETSSESEAKKDARIRYVLMTSVPENWIPFIPVHMSKDDNREIQLQRAAMLRILSGSEEESPKIRPRTVLLRHNIQGAYFIHEEEVPRAGAQVTRTFQRARWHDGKVCVWLGRRKRIGRGEGSSGLVFDQLKPNVRV